MDMDVVHLWASMNNLVRGVVVVLTLQALSCIAVVVDRLILLFLSARKSRAFAKAAGRPMTAQDWSSWLAGKALAAAAVAAPKGPVAAFQKALAEVQADGSKGVAMGFRAWDGQLRQPMLLSDGQGVVATAPIDGLLHPKNVLDTLGADAPEKLCKARP